MQSKGAKIAFIVILIAFAIGAYWFYNHGPFAEMNNEAKKAYHNYVKTEATIVSQESNGRIGKGANTIWTMQFKNDKGEVVTATMDKNALPTKENGDKLNIYYDAENLNAIISEEHYNEVMH